MLLQVAVRDIGQLTYFEASDVHRSSGAGLRFPHSRFTS